MKPMETIHDLIDEAKARTLYWALCIFAFTYFLSHTSSSMWMNLPLSILLFSALRVLFNNVEFSWKTHKPVRPPSYLSHLEKKQLSVNDSRLYSTPPPPRWKRKIDSPTVEAAVNEFIDKILKDFVVDLWYSEITPDKEAPELMRAVIMDAIGEISGRVKEINLVDLVTRDIVDLIGDHLDLFRRNQAAIGVDVMRTLSTEQRDERLKFHLMSSKELHPALISPESEYKVLQRLIGGVLAVVLKPREAQCPLVRVIAREIVTCLVMQPVMDLASPGYINELIECILLAIKDGSLKEVGGDLSAVCTHQVDSTSSNYSSINSQKADNFDNKKNYQVIDMPSAKVENSKEAFLNSNPYQQEYMLPRHADWARMLEAATQRRTEVLMPENLENMWTKGRNYKKKENKNVKSRVQQSMAKGSMPNSASPTVNFGKEILTNSIIAAKGTEEKAVERPTPLLCHENPLSDETKIGRHISQDYNKQLSLEEPHVSDELENTGDLFKPETKSRLKRSSSTSALKVQPEKRLAFKDGDEGPIIPEFYTTNFGWHSEDITNKVSDIIIRREGPLVPKLKCRVMGAYFEKLNSKSFAVYSIAVTDTENRTWFVKRRYRNFERLHRHLKDIPNYTLHLPPKRIFSSSTEDAFVHQRCIQLDKYLQDLLSIANVAEQHEVWDFLSATSKNYSFGKSSSVMRTLAVNVDDAVDDIVRQFKGVSDGLMRKVVRSPSLMDETYSSINNGNSSLHAEDMNKHVLRQDTSETLNSFSDNEESHLHESHAREEVGSTAQAKGWHSDNELNTTDFQPRVIKHDAELRTIGSERIQGLGVKSEWINQGSFPIEDPVGMPPEWTPPNVSVPLLNLVDKVFQLKKRGWLRRQVFWISKQILHLVMDDAIDDWLMRQIYWLRREETVALGIRWVQDVLWPDGTFFTRVGVTPSNADDASLSLFPFQISQLGGTKGSKQGTFEEQLEAARRASDIKKMLFDGAPTALVSLIGNKQYKLCARDIFYFTQSTICMKQLAYGILELLLLSVFPELRNLLLAIHEKMRVPPV